VIKPTDIKKKIHLFIFNKYAFLTWKLTHLHLRNYKAEL